MAKITVTHTASVSGGAYNRIGNNSADYEIGSYGTNDSAFYVIQLPGLGEFVIPSDAVLAAQAEISSQQLSDTDKAKIYFKHLISGAFRQMRSM
jgi:hypothetical protein